MAIRRIVVGQRTGQRPTATFGPVPPPMPLDALPANRRGAHGKAGARSEGAASFQREELQGVYIISVAARLLEMHPQTLRKYERVGLVSPSRTLGMLRLYSAQDIARLRLIKHLVDDLRMNLAGVEFALGMWNRLLQVRQQLATMTEEEDQEGLGHELDRVKELLETALLTIEQGESLW